MGLSPAAEGEPGNGKQGRRETRCDILVLGCFALLAAFVHFASLGIHADRYTPPPDMPYFADTARSLLNNRGLVSNRILPRAAFDFGTDPTPFQSKAVLGPLVVAASFLVFGVGDRAALVAQIPFVLLSLLPLYRIAYRLAGRPAALAAGLLYFSAPQTWYFGLGGLREPLYGWLLAEMLSLAIAERPRPILLGALAGLMYLTREAIVIPGVVAVAGLIYRPIGTRWGFAIRLIPVATIIAFPAAWLAWIAGSVNPSSGIIAYKTSLYPGDAQMLTLDRFSNVDFVTRHPILVLGKCLRALPLEFVRLSLFLTNPVTIVLALKALLRPAGRIGLSAALVTWAVFLITLAGDLAVDPSERHFSFLAPVLAALAGSALAMLICRRPGSATPAVRKNLHRLVPTLALVFALPWAGVHAWNASQEHSTRREAEFAEAAITAFVRPRIAPGTPIFSNQPRFTAWYGDYPTVWLPYHFGDLLALAEKRRIPWIVIVNLPAEATYDMTAYDRSMRDLVDGRLSGIGPYVAADSGMVGRTIVRLFHLDIR
jgi:4-amino-4-deoxy-L-arabinose transferase-like glycosyltransferase